MEKTLSQKLEKVVEIQRVDYQLALKTHKM